MVRITELQNKISKNTLSEGYLSGITEFPEKYASALNDITQNREEVVMILRMIVDSMVVSIHDQSIKITSLPEGRRNDNRF